MAADAIVDAVADMAGLLGWMVHHDRPGRTAEGWRTAIRGHQGFPDLVLVHPRHGIIFAECKGAKNAPTQEQALWLATLRFHARDAGPVRICVWRPIHLTDGTIERILRGG